MKRPAGNDPEAFVRWLWRYVDRSAQAGALLDWIEQRAATGLSDAALGAIFWRVVALAWPSFDRIDHGAYSDAFQRFRPYWKQPPEVAALQRLVTLYRGQDRHVPVGLSWTMSRKTAAVYAQGLRARRNDDPVVLATFITRDDIALALDWHGQTDIVVWTPPSDCTVV